MKEIRIPTILGVLVSVVGLVSGLWLISGQVRQSAQASEEEKPRELRITNVSDTGFTVSWITNQKVSGFVQYGEPGVVDLVVSDERDQQKGSVGLYKTHYAVVKGLKQGTKYQFRVGSGKNLYDNNGKLYEVTTGPSLGTPPPADMAYGQVLAGGEPSSEGAIVYVSVGDAAPLSALVKASGSWVVPLSTARSADLGKYAQYDKTNGKVDILVQGESLTASLTTTTAKDTPVPDITLGQAGQVNLGETKTEAPINQMSKFKLEAATEATAAGQIILLTPRFGEKVNSGTPEIIGTAPAGTEIEIEIHSEAVVTGKVKADRDGKFSFSVPKELPPGEHTITLKGVVDGVTKTITRSFTVYAAGESSLPAFSASPSATLTPVRTTTPTPAATIAPTTTPRPTARVATGTPVPTAAASPSATLKPSPSPTVTPTKPPTPTAARTVNPATGSAMPKSGNAEPGLWMMMLGMGLLISGLWWYKTAA